MRLCTIKVLIINYLGLHNETQSLDILIYIITIMHKKLIFTNFLMSFIHLLIKIIDSYSNNLIII